jgi:hypothetical protein
MGLQDRDYMRRPSGDDDDNRSESSPGSHVETWLEGFFARHPKLPLAVGITLAALFVAALVYAKLG